MGALARGPQPRERSACRSERSAASSSSRRPRSSRRSRATRSPPATARSARAPPARRCGCAKSSTSSPSGVDRLGPHAGRRRRRGRLARARARVAATAAVNRRAAQRARHLARARSASCCAGEAPKPGEPNGLAEVRASRPGATSSPRGRRRAPRSGRRGRGRRSRGSGGRRGTGTAGRARDRRARARGAARSGTSSRYSPRNAMTRMPSAPPGPLTASRDLVGVQPGAGHDALRFDRAARRLDDEARRAVRRRHDPATRGGSSRPRPRSPRPASGTPRRSRRSRCRARAARRRRRRGARARADARVDAARRARRWRRSAVRARPGAPARGRQRRRRPCRTPRGRSRARGSTRPSSAGPAVQSRAFVGTRLRSRRPRGSRPELRPLWWPPTDASFSTSVSARPGCERRTARAVARPTIPPPTTSTSARSMRRQAIGWWPGLPGRDGGDCLSPPRSHRK